MRIGPEEGSCKFCGKIFSTIRGLCVHLSKHIGEKKFQCEICSNKYTTEVNLKAHLTKAHGVTLFECEICSKKSFTSQEKLDAHRAQHSVNGVIQFV